MARTLIRSSLLLVALSGLGCTAVTSEVEAFAETACAPNAQQACTCLDSLTEGVQVCAEDGSGFTACVCAAADGHTVVSRALEPVLIGR